MLRFAVTEKRETRFGSNDCHKTKYGIEIIEGKKVLRTFNDITYEKATINTFADLCNKHQVSPVHFDDVLENFLSDFEGL